MRRSAATGAITLFTFASTAAYAEVTAQQIWSDWQAIIAGYGISLNTQSETMAGDTLTVAGIEISMTLPDGAFKTQIDEMTFQNLSGGTVAITMSPEYRLDLEGTSPEDGEIAIGILVKQEGLTTIASGDPGQTSYDYLAPSIVVSVDELMVENENTELVAEIELSSIKGNYTLTQGTPVRVASDLSADSLTVNVSGSDPDDSSARIDISASIADLTSTQTGTMTSIASMANMSALLQEGFESEGAISYGRSDYTITGAGDGQTFNMTGGADTGNFEFALNNEGLFYGGGNTGLEFAVSGSEIPFPQLTFAVAETEAKLTMPLTVSEDPQDMGILMKLIDLEVSDVLWSLFDPTNALPRDPATVVLDITGQGNWLIDIMDPEIAENPPMESPGEIHAITVNDIVLSAAGAELTGTGDFTFDNTDTTTFDGMPRPEGSLNLMLVGGNTLIDKLVAMGLVPEEQAMGARMMLGLFARPGDGEDTLVSTIEISEDGSVLANGQRIR